ncbi:uncharacterized protein LOC130828560 [Amaranthus tricolor]|uniref:uncharacterized protein LOC130828560 n=1 Tax=Amaranthus tricolor TaxID=29722 RepID=UPI002588C3F2|nr:uncharacterized protein LOC130828560 [Amaranthus tricolor]
MANSKETIPANEKVFLGGDFNGHIGKEATNYNSIHGGFGYGVRNESDESLLELVLAKELVIANSIFRKKDEHLITYKSGKLATQIDYFLVRRDDRSSCLDCKVVLGTEMPTQHRVLVLVFRMRRKIAEKKLKGREMIMWGRLKGDKVATLSSKIKMSGYLSISNDANQMWETMAETIRKIKDKNRRFKELMACTEEEDRKQNRERYKEAKREAKKAVAEAKSRAFEAFYQKLDTKEGEKYIFKLAKARSRQRKDLGTVKGLAKESRPTTGIRRTWVYGSFSDITTAELREALKKIGGFKAVGLGNIPIEVWRGLGEEGIHWLTELFNAILRSSKMPEEWRVSTIIPLFKNKGDAQECGNYRGIKLLNYTMKLWERVIEKRLRRETVIRESQFGFMLGRSTIEAIHLFRRLMEKYRERKKDLHLVFIDLEKAYDSIPQSIIWDSLKNSGISQKYITVIQDMYNRVSTNIQTPVGMTESFPKFKWVYIRDQH